jgi:hypothetical protein
MLYSILALFADLGWAKIFRRNHINNTLESNQAALRRAVSENKTTAGKGKYFFSSLSKFIDSMTNFKNH